MNIELFENLAFEDEDEFRIFKDILSSLNHVTPRLIKRNEFNKLNGNYIKETGEDEYGKYYNLFLPKDLKQGELLEIIISLNYIFNLEKESNIKSIISQTKIIISLILRNGKEKELKIMCEKYNISQKLINKISQDKINFTDAKKFLKEIINDSGKQEKNEVDGIEKLIKNLRNEFEFIFLRKGIRILANNMKTITLKEQIKIEDEDENEEIVMHVENEKLDKEEQLLRDKIGIDSMKIILKKAREKGNRKLIEELEINAANMVIHCLYDFPYQMTEKNYGYQPAKIVKSKELYCVGYCMLGHAFLKELGIKHRGIFSHPSHSVLELEIGGKLYYFDASYFNSIHEFEYGKRIKRANEKGKCRELIFNNKDIEHGELSDDKKAYGYGVDIETFLLSNVYINKGTEYTNKNTQKSLQIAEKVLKLIPNCLEAYYNKGVRLLQINEIEEGLKNLELAIQIYPKDAEIYFVKSKAYYKIGNYNESLRMLNIAQNLNQKEEYIYLEKAKIYKLLGNKKMSNIYKFIGDYLDLQNKDILKPYFEEKLVIMELIEEGNYKGLLKYLRKIEEKEIRH